MRDFFKQIVGVFLSIASFHAEKNQEPLPDAGYQFFLNDYSGFTYPLDNGTHQNSPVFQLARMLATKDIRFKSFVWIFPEKGLR